MTLKPEQYHALASAHGITWVGEFPPNSKVKTTWICANGHRFQSIYGDIKQGHGCSYCTGRAKKTADDYHAFAKEIGFTWLGEMPKNATAKTKWVCRAGHEVIASYAALHFNHTYGCRKCFHDNVNAPRKLTAAQFHAAASSHGIFWTGTTPVGWSVLTSWRCANGHEWEANYQSVSRIDKCPYCYDRHNGNFASKPQRALHAITGGILNYRNKRVGRYCIDIALDTDTLFPIALEYDAYFWHSKQLEQDAKRDKWLLTHGWSILRIKSAHLVPPAAEIHAAIARLRRGETTYTEIVMSDYKP